MVDRSPTHLEVLNGRCWTIAEIRHSRPVEPGDRSRYGSHHGTTPSPAGGYERLDEDTWRLRVYKGDAKVELTSLMCTIALAELYDGVPLD